MYIMDGSLWRINVLKDLLCTSLSTVVLPWLQGEQMKSCAKLSKATAQMAQGILNELTRIIFAKDVIL